MARSAALLGIGITIVLILTLAFSLTSTMVTVYNTIIASRAMVDQSLSDLDAAYQKRYALVENFVTITKETNGFETFQIEVERGIYSEVAKAKAEATRMSIAIPSDVGKRLASESQLHASLLQDLSKLLVLAQHYPTITDPVIKDRNATFNALKELKVSLEGLESTIEQRRMTFNYAVRTYNQNIKIFPANFFTVAWGFEPLTGFEALSPEAKQDVKIKF